MGENNMLVAKFVNNNYVCDNVSYAKFGIPVEKVMLVLPINENVDINPMKLKGKAILLKISENNIVDCQRNSAFYVNKAIPIRYLNNEELSILRSAAVQYPELAYEYAFYVDKKPTNETRSAACQHPELAYWYALSVDLNPTNKTRSAACQHPEYAYMYARYVDRKPTDETRSAAGQYPEFAYKYAKYVDQKPTNETGTNTTKNNTKNGRNQYVSSQICRQ
jgi:hypothetical protein